jgi:hypothetical protein
MTEPGSSGLLVLAMAAGLALLISLPLWSHLRHNPVHVPEGMAIRTLDGTVLERDLAAEAMRRRRSGYRSDRRSGRAEA